MVESDGVDGGSMISRESVEGAIRAVRDDAHSPYQTRSGPLSRRRVRRPTGSSPRKFELPSCTGSALVRVRSLLA